MTRYLARRLLRACDECRDACRGLGDGAKHDLRSGRHASSVVIEALDLSPVSRGYMPTRPAPAGAARRRGPNAKGRSDPSGLARDYVCIGPLTRLVVR